ncbi:hypothetical protein [Reyranella sp.]|uniref:hypothetical protein n=1 Tax=Reyranella sp. TaxID=1929291 RepID=UPI003F7115EB
MSTIATLLADIEEFCREADIAEATFSTRAVNDGKFVKRLRQGANVTVALVDRVRAYMDAERSKVRAAAEAATVAASADTGETA